MLKDRTFVQSMALADVKKKGCHVVHINGHTIALVADHDEVFAIDNRCPHMGFPMDKGSIKDGIITCHWHHARFDLASGGTFDQFADDVRSFPTEVRDGYVWVDVTDQDDPKERQRDRLKVGLERDIPLVIAKAVLVLLDNGGDAAEPFKTGIEFGTTYRNRGWGQGLTMLTCMMNMLPHLHEEDRPRALYHGLSAVTRDTSGMAPRFPIRPLPGETPDIATLKRWFRQFIAVRDSEGSERCIISAIRAGATKKEMADMLFSAVTDYRYIDIGHPADFTNKAFEALDIVGWDHAETVLTSLVSGYTVAARMEESNAWRNPIDLIEILHESFSQIDNALSAGDAARQSGANWNGRQALVDTLLSDDPHAIAKAMLGALRAGCTIQQLASTVSYAAALRVARFHTSNEFGDWDTALHTFTFSNAIEQGLKRAPSPELLRGVFDGAMSIYLDRFLNIPAARIPSPNRITGQEGLAELPRLLNQQQQVNQSAKVVASVAATAEADQLLPLLGQLLLREDRDFHTIQCMEAAIKQHELLKGTPEASHVLIAAIRYLAAHSPTVRAQEQTFAIARRLHRGDHLFEEDSD
ncbi:MAG: Rieske (2Fe-2S) protein [Anaerolineae bacterium]